MVSKLVQALVVKATPPLKTEPTEMAMKCLDEMMECVDKLKGRKISRILLELTTCNDITSRIENHCKEINSLLETVIMHLGSSLNVEFFESTGPGNLRKHGYSLLVKPRFLPLLAAVGFASLLAGLSLGPALLGACVIGNVILRPSNLLLIEYDLVLKAAIEEASKWPEEASKGPETLERTGVNNDNSTFDLEEELIKHVDRSPKFKKIVKESHLLGINSVPSFKSKAFQDATPESKLKLLKRIKLVYDTIWLYNEEVARVHFMGVFGAEDAGKSTFIQKVLEKYPSFANQSIPSTAFGTHTTNVTSYKLVDFPGSNATRDYADKWKQFTALSSSAVLFLEFNFDVKAEQVQMYRELKEKLGFRTEVAIVFNKVDLRFTPGKRKMFSADYFQSLKKNNETQLECSGSKDRVYFACVDPEIELVDLIKLKEMGVLDFEGLHKELVKRSTPSSSVTS